MAPNAIPPSTERVLTTRELNRALLARQLLLKRARMPLIRALERVAGLQAQYAPSAYVGLWSRLEGFRREDLTKALGQRRAVQGTLMRATIHIVSARDYPLFAAAVREGRREWWARVQRRLLKGIEMKAVAADVRAYLADGPRRAAVLQTFLAAQGYPRIAAVSAGMWVDLVRVPPSGTWDRPRADLYALADEWLGPSRVTRTAGLKHLIERYLGGFGPASIDDLASWSGLPPTMLRPVVARLRLRRFRDERGGELLDLPRTPLPHPDTPAPVRFLPTWDATLLAHARRAQILPEPYRPRVFNTRTPHSVSTFLVDGQVAGTWRYEKGRVRLEPFRPLTSMVRHAVEEEAEWLVDLSEPSR